MVSKSQNTKRNKQRGKEQTKYKRRGGRQNFFSLLCLRLFLFFCTPESGASSLRLTRSVKEMKQTCRVQAVVGRGRKSLLEKGLKTGSSEGVKEEQRENEQPTPCSAAQGTGIFGMLRPIQLYRSAGRLKAWRPFLRHYSLPFPLHWPSL